VGALNHRIERVRHAAHRRALARREFGSMFAAVGRHTLETYQQAQSRSSPAKNARALVFDNTILFIAGERT